jgi:SP family sugar:H+ symporter-like MFS transporter
MKFFKKNASKEVGEKGTPNSTTPAHTPTRGNSILASPVEAQYEGKIAPIAVVLGAVASIGGFMFGYESGQISGFLAMSDFIDRFGENGAFSPVRQGTIVGLLA